MSREVDEEAKRLIKGTEEAALERGEELQWGILDGFLLYWDPVGPSILSSTSQHQH